VIYIGIIHPYQLIRKPIKILMQNDEEHYIQVEHQIFQPDCLIYTALDILLVDDSNYNNYKKDIHELIRFHHVKIIVLAQQKESINVLHAIQQNVYGVLLNQELGYDQLLSIIHRVYKGNKFISDSLTPEVIQGYYTFYQEKETSDKLEPQPPTHLLTKREIETLGFLAEGLSNPEIASAMRISEKTVKNNIANMFQKVHVNNRNKLVAVAIKNNWVSIG